MFQNYGNMKTIKAKKLVGIRRNTFIIQKPTKNHRFSPKFLLISKELQNPSPRNFYETQISSGLTYSVNFSHNIGSVVFPISCFKSWKRHENSQSVSSKTHQKASFFRYIFANCENQTKINKWKSEYSCFTKTVKWWWYQKKTHNMKFHVYSLSMWYCMKCFIKANRGTSIILSL